MTDLTPNAAAPVESRADGAARPAADATPAVRIRARGAWNPLDWRELWAGREILYFLIWRDLKVRYRQTVLGVAWAVLQPLLAMLIFTVIFGMFARIPSENLPYPVFVYAGLLPFTFFSSAVLQASQSLINQQHLMTKVYLPRVFIPTASVASCLIDLLLSGGVYAAILALYGIAVGWAALAVIPLTLLTVTAALGLSVFLSALTVAYRDFRYVVPFMMQLLMYLSPVVYPVSIVPERYQWVLALNPLAGIIDGYRAALLGRPWNFTALGVSTLMTLVVFAIGVLYFRRTERRFADIA